MAADYKISSDFFYENLSIHFKVRTLHNSFSIMKYEIQHLDQEYNLELKNGKLIHSITIPYKIEVELMILQRTTA